MGSGTGKERPSEKEILRHDDPVEGWAGGFVLDEEFGWVMMVVEPKIVNW